MSTKMEDGHPKETTSLVVKYDDLRRNCNVLLDTSENQFLSFVMNAGVTRRRWEHAELECQRLGIELTKTSQEISSLELKLSQARDMLEAEQSQRRKAETERDRLDQQLRLLRELVLDDHLVDEVKLSQIRSLGVHVHRQDHERSEDAMASPSCLTPKGILKNNNTDAAESILDVDDLSIDDTRDLCESRSRLGRRSTSSRKRSRSTAGRDIGDNILESIASPRSETCSKKRSRRTRSVVAFENASSEELSSEDTEMRARSNSAHERNIIEPASSSNILTTSNTFHGNGAAHNFVQKAFIKSEKCGVCDKRFKFGRVSSKCSLCRLVVHNECVDRVPIICSGRGSPEVCKTPLADINKSPKRKQYFASPRLL